MKRRIAFLALVLGFFVLACQLIAGIDRVEKQDTPPPVPDVVTEAPPPTPDPCAHVVAADRPLKDDGVAVEVPPFFIAMKSLFLVPKTDGGTVGFDLDNVCTCDVRPGERREGGSSCKPRAGAICDDDGGVDNRVYSLFRDFGPLGLDLDDKADVNQRIAAGTATVLLEVFNYNGLANDKEIQVGFILSPGSYERSRYADGGPGPDHADPGTLEYPAAFEGFDTWTVDPRSVTAGLDGGGQYLPLFKGSGYVTDHVLVVSFDSSVELAFGPGRLAVGSPLLTGRLTPLGADFQPRDPARAPATELEKRFYALTGGKIGGRITARDWLAGVGTLVAFGSKDAAAPNSHFCTSPLFQTAIKYTCDNLDIARSARLDFDINADCDSLSFGAAIEGVPALAGAPRSEDAGPANECTAGPTGPAAAGPDSMLYVCPPK